jgi:hypothetical protein
MDDTGAIIPRLTLTILLTSPCTSHTVEIMICGHDIELFMFFSYTQTDLAKRQGSVCLASNWFRWRWQERVVAVLILHAAFLTPPFYIFVSLRWTTELLYFTEAHGLHGQSRVSLLFAFLGRIILGNGQLVHCMARSSIFSSYSLSSCEV